MLYNNILHFSMQKQQNYIKKWIHGILFIIKKINHLKTPIFNIEIIQNSVLELLNQLTIDDEVNNRYINLLIYYNNLYNILYYLY